MTMSATDSGTTIPYEINRERRVMLAPATPLTVTLTAAEWNLVLSELGRARFHRVARLILGIQAQCQAQDTLATGATVSRLRPEPIADTSA